MGGDGHGHGGFDTRSVWSPSGGWYADPRYWRRNTAVAFGVLAVVSYGIASVSAKLEVRPRRLRLRSAARAQRAASRPPLELGLRSRACAAPRSRGACWRVAGGCVTRHGARSAALRVPRLCAPSSARRSVSARPSRCAERAPRPPRSNGRWRRFGRSRRSGGATTSPSRRRRISLLRRARFCRPPTVQPPPPATPPAAPRKAPIERQQQRLELLQANGQRWIPFLVLKSLDVWMRLNGIVLV
jgi:hypothetical protein